MLVFPSTASAKNDANADLTLTSTTPSVKSGTTGVLQLDVKVAGSQESIQESYGSAATLVVQLPKDAAAYYDLQTPLADLVDRTVNGDTVTWTFKAPSLEAQKAAGTTLFACEILLTTSTDASISAYTKVPNNVTISAVSIEDQTKTAAAKAEAQVAPGGNDVPLSSGNVVVPYTVGPANGNGSVSSKEQNPNPVVSDDGMVRFRDTYFMGLSGGEKLFDSTGSPVDRSLWNQNNFIM